MRSLRRLIVAKAKELLSKDPHAIDEREVKALEVSMQAYSTLKMHDDQAKFRIGMLGCVGGHSEAPKADEE